MKHRNRIYNLILNNQESLLELLISMDVKNPFEKIKAILDEELFEIVECDADTIIKIRKKSTGEVFEKGGKFYHTKYGKWIENISFDESLFGTYYWDSYYKNYVRAGGGLYHLNEMSLST